MTGGRQPVAALAVVMAAGSVGLASAGWRPPALHDRAPAIFAAVDSGIPASWSATT